MQVHDITERLVAAALSEDPMAAVRGELELLKTDLDAVAQALSYIPGTGGNALQAFYRTPELSLLKVTFPAGRRTPPHDHGTWASILVFSGLEKNTLYRDEDCGLRRASEVALSRGSILPMREETVHVAECTGNEPAVGLHVYEQEKGTCYFSLKSSMSPFLVFSSFRGGTPIRKSTSASWRTDRRSECRYTHECASKLRTDSPHPTPPAHHEGKRGSG